MYLTCCVYMIVILYVYESVYRFIIHIQCTFPRIKQRNNNNDDNDDDDDDDDGNNNNNNN